MTCDVDLVKHSTELNIMHGRNHGLFLIFFFLILDVTDTKAYMCVVCMLSCSYKCCYVGGLKMFSIFRVLRRFPCRKWGGLHSRNIGKT